MIYLYAFLIGGLICMAGQLLMDLTKLTPARILVLFVCLGVVLGGLLGVFTGGFTACAGGVTVAVLSALVVAWVARPKDK